MAGLYEALRASKQSLHRDELIEWLTILKDDFLNSSTMLNDQRRISLRTDEDIRREVDRCFQLSSHSSSDGLQLNEIIDYFLGPNDSLGEKVKASWNARLHRHEEKQQKRNSKFHAMKSSSPRSNKQRKVDSTNKPVS